jgi:hypothetical protein
LFRSTLLERIEHERRRTFHALQPELREPDGNCCLPGATNPELADVFAVAPRTVDNSNRDPGAHRA